MGISKDKQQQRVELGRFGKVHGIKGWLRLNSFTTPPENICSYQSIVAEIGGKLVVLEFEEFRIQGKGLVVHIKGFNDPESAKALTGKGVWIESSALPALDAGEYYWHQLEGLRVVNQQGAIYGVVTELLETGANDVLVVAPSIDSIDERQRLIPYLKGSVVLEVSPAECWIRVNWEADYLE